MVEEHQFEENSQDADVTEQGGHTASGDTALLEKINNLESTIAEIQNANQQVVHLLKSKTDAQVAKEPELTEEQLKAFASNPQLLTKFLSNQVEASTRKIQNEAKKAQYDAKAYDEHPALKTNKEFQKAVISKMNELIGADGYTQDSPMLLYRAAQLAAVQVGRGDMTSKRTAADTTSAEPSQIRQNRQGSTKIDDNDPRVVFARMTGQLSKEKIEAFKKELTPYVAPERVKERRLIRER
jgi:hypothetical protein